MTYTTAVLPPNNYTFTVKAFDTSGNKNTGVTVGSDNKPPALVTNLTVANYTTSARLTWTNPADTDFDKVEITYRTSAGGTATNYVSKPTTTTDIGGLSDGTVYDFEVKSVDTSSNKSISVTASKYIGTPNAGRADATGGVTTFVNNGNGTWDEVHTFATVGNNLLTLKPNKVPVNARVLVVGGGGTGGNGTQDAGGGGGGAGGVLYQASYTLSSNNINIKVGNVLEESWLGSINNLLAERGGNGHDGFAAPNNYQGGDGGSNGGTKNNNINTNGHGGGYGFQSNYGGVAGGGGGGAGGNGYSHDDLVHPSAGGAGVNNDISGASRTYGVGGSGADSGPSLDGPAIDSSGNNYGSAGQQGVVIVRWNWID